MARETVAKTLVGLADRRAQPSTVAATATSEFRPSHPELGELAFDDLAVVGVGGRLQLLTGELCVPRGFRPVLGDQVGAGERWLAEILADAGVKRSG